MSGHSDKGRDTAFGRQASGLPHSSAEKPPASAGGVVTSPTARDAAEGLAEIEDVLAEHKAGRISGSLAASTIGLMFLKHQGPLLAALRSAGTEGGETQGAVELAHKDRLLALRTRQNTQASQLWAKAAEQALAGDPRALHDRLQLHRDSAATAARILQSGATLHTRTTDGGEA